LESLRGSAPRPRPLPSDSLAARLHYLSLPVAFAGLVWYTQRQYFTKDDWEFIHRLIPGVGRLGWFAPHNEHWSTLPLLVYRTLFAIFGLRTYVPYMAVLLALHVLTAHLLWRIMRIGGADTWVATAVTAVFLVLGTGAENITWAFQIGFVGALAAGLGMVLAVLRSSPRRLVLAWLLGVCSLMFSGLGPVMVAIAGLTVLLMFGWRRALLTVSLPAAVYAVWLLAIGLTRTAVLPHGSILLVPDYVVTGITSAAAGITGLRFVGALLLIPLAWWLGVRARHCGEDAAIVALAAGTVLFFLVVGLGRVGLGVQESMSSRYVYIAAVLLLPAVAVAASHVTHRHVLLLTAVVLAVAWSGVHNLRALQLNLHAVTPMREHTEARIVAASHLAATVTAVGPQPESSTAPDLTWSDLVYLVTMHDLPLQSLIPPDQLDMVTVAANVQMASSSRPFLPGGTTSIEAVGGARLSPVSPGCVAVSGAAPAVRLIFPSAAAVMIRAPAAALITARLYLSPASSTRSPRHAFTTGASGTVYLDVSLADAAAVLDLPPHGAVLCGLAP
jgi:hypothetical protein